MMGGIISFFKRLAKFEVSVPAIFGGANVSDQEKKPVRSRQYKILDGIVKIFGKAKKKDDILNATKKPRKIGLIPPYQEKWS